MNRSFTAFAMALVGCLALSGCSTATDNKPATSAPTADLPTVANLTGTWTVTTTGVENFYQQSTSTTKGGHFTRTTTVVFGADRSYWQKYVTVDVPDDGSATQSFYEQGKGVFTAVDDALTVSIGSARAAYSDFADDTTGWIAQSPAAISTTPAILSSGKLYNSNTTVFKAQGATSGIVGNWSYTQMYTTASPPYHKFTVTFNADLTASTANYDSSSSTFPSTPTSTQAGTYSLGSGGTVTLTPTGGPAGTPSYYSIVGSYLLIGATPDLGASVKQ